MSFAFRVALDEEIRDLTEQLDIDPSKVVDAEIVQAQKLLAMTKRPQLKRAINNAIKKMEEAKGEPRDEKSLRERLDLCRKLHMVIEKLPDYQPKKRRGRKPGRKPKNPLA